MASPQNPLWFHSRKQKVLPGGELASSLGTQKIAKGGQKQPWGLNTYFLLTVPFPGTVGHKILNLINS